ncbi:MAG TPA: hypothetical protein VLH59_13335 [Ignavibacteriaceae bacterium]|nr:hypothetical protein [Ignavibacteriaceae bacterium]
MKTKVILSTVLILSFALISSGFIYNDISVSDDKKNQSECSYLQGKVENACPYLEGKVDKSDSEYPNLSGKTTCPYSGKESKTETESSNKGKSKEIKFYMTIKNIST